MKRLMPNILLLFILGVLFTPCFSQNRTGSKSLFILAESQEDPTPDEALKVVNRFFELPKNNNRAEWEKLLSKECFNKNGIKDSVDRWYKVLSTTKKQYQVISEKFAPRNDQRFFYISDSTKPENEKPIILVLVKERGKWKIFYIKL